MKNLSSTPYLLALALTTLMSAGCDDAAPGEAQDFGGGEVAERCLNGCGGIRFNTFAWGYEDGGALDTKGNLFSNAQLVSVELLCPTNEKDMWRFPKECFKSTYFTLDKGGVRAKAGELLGTREIYEFAGKDFLGSRWTVDVYNAEGKFLTTHHQEIKAYKFDPLQKPHALHYYTFMFFGNGANGGEKGVWEPACTENTDPTDNTPVGAWALVYDDIEVDTKSGKIFPREHSLYLGCISAAVGKAGNWGYPSWEIGTDDFTTAVRTVRADYCGDGDSWTKKGNALQVKDVWGYGGFVDPNAATEAIWNEKGAACLGTPRWLAQFSYSDVTCNGEKLPECKNATLTDITDAIIWTKLP